MRLISSKSSACSFYQLKLEMLHRRHISASTENLHLIAYCKLLLKEG